MMSPTGPAGTARRAAGGVDVACIGGGVIGLMTAWELAGRGLRVAVIERGRFGAEASWAGAGIIPPASLEHATDDFGRLRGFSFAAYPQLAEQLRHETGREIGYQKTGGLELVLDPAPTAELHQRQALWRAENLAFSPASTEQLAGLKPGWYTDSTEARNDADIASPLPQNRAWYFPDFCQVRNPRLVEALQQACRARGVKLLPHTTVVELIHRDHQVQMVYLGHETSLPCGQVLLAAGAWTGRLAAPLGMELPIRPVQGQIVLLRQPRPEVRYIVMAGKHYLVPRPDGLVLVGATEEERGFVKRVTPRAYEQLYRFAIDLYPSLAEARIEATWAGLRPGNSLGSPLLGLAPGWKNLWLATGHFRQGVQLAPGTARLLADWLTGTPSFAAPSSFTLTADRRGFHHPFHS